MRPRLARISTLTLAAVLPLILHVEQADACSCMRPGTPAEEYRSAGAVFVGKVLSVEAVGVAEPTIPSRMLQVTLAVERAFKGVAGERAVVRTARNSAACGYRFEPGTAHLVYARGGQADGLRVSLCSRTQPLEHADEDIAALEELVGAAPATPEQPATPAAPAPPHESPAQVPAGKGGCAGCATSAGTGGGSALLVLLLGLWLSRIRTRTVPPEGTQR